MADRPHLKGILGLHMLYLHLEYLFTGSYIGLKLKLSCPVLASYTLRDVLSYLLPQRQKPRYLNQSQVLIHLRIKMPERI